MQSAHTKASLLVACTLTFGCDEDGPQPDLDAALAPVDAAAKEDAQRPDAAIPDCPVRSDSCPMPAWRTSFDSWSTLLEASEFGPQAYLVAADGEAVLIDDGAGTHWLLALQGEAPLMRTSWRLPDGLRALDVNARIDSFLVLASDDAGTCSILETKQGALQPATIAPPPADARATRLYGTTEGLCVAGNGFWCLAGESWEQRVFGPIARVWFANAGTVVEGADGAFWLYASTADAQLVLREYHDLRFLKAGNLVQRGEQLIRWTGEEAEVCELPPLALFTGGEALTLQGALLHFDRERSQFCETTMLAPLEPVLDTTYATCGILANPRVLTARALYGTASCALD